MFIGTVIVLFVSLHLTPNLALRTHVLMMGHPQAAISSSIVDDYFHNRVDKEKLAEENAKCYSLSSPPVEKSTQGFLKNYIVKKKGFLYFADYYGDA
ncbi:hypothetical protein [Pseudalkalibacillus caeni]|uniref:Uncharacterized protein n=1 Tax=Exobacillus caeni TaxID=2574798 RepID=A0A5R9F7Y5_9BACL|nr:hypothetical protein [Pseudalkalibacillus caeni]TLS36953.1 hypothetical protein FCL54_13435 [Pseudalkalibacillus caeni]